MPNAALNQESGLESPCQSTDFNSGGTLYGSNVWVPIPIQLLIEPSVGRMAARAKEHASKIRLCRHHSCRTWTSLRMLSPVTGSGRSLTKLSPRPFASPVLSSPFSSSPLPSPEESSRLTIPNASQCLLRASHPKRCTSQI